MNGKIKFMIPAFAAVFALMFVVVTPYVMAEEDGEHTEEKHAKWGGADHNKKHMKIQIGELSGSEPITMETIHDKKDEVIALSVISYNYPDAKKASIGIAVNDAGEKFLVWKVVTMTKNDDGVKSVTIHVVDALLGYEITTIEKSFDHSSMDGKWSHYGMHDKFAELTPEEHEAKYAHFKEMKQEYATLSDEEKDAKHTEFKSKMEEFSALSLDEKIIHLQEFANSLR